MSISHRRSRSRRWSKALSRILFLAAIAAAGQEQPLKGSVISTGAERLVAEGIKHIHEMRVGLITNPTGRVGDRHLADVLHEAPRVELTALFGPEHGIRGDAAAGESVDDKIDKATGVPVHSLYGAVRKPTQEMLSDVDVLLFDIQDIGARMYTYVSTMGYAMQAAAENKIPFIVLDRPNPLGGKRVEGFLLEPDAKSFVGLYPIPTMHGMTVGELARLIQGEDLLEGLGELDLYVVQMKGWQRDMLWSDLEREWIPPSPNIPDFETAIIYPGVCFVEGTIASEGRGTKEPFKLIGAPWIDAEKLARDLNRRGLSGLYFEPESFIPNRIPGMALRPKFRNTKVHGIRHVISDPEMVHPVRAGIHLLDALLAQAPDKSEFFHEGRLRRLAGSRRLQQMLLNGRSPTEIVDSWSHDIDRFRRSRKPYLLYPSE